MMSKSGRYTGTAKWLHWGIALIWIGAWCIGMLATHWQEEFNSHHELTFLHKAMASTILFLVVARIAWRLKHPAPELPDAISPLMERSAFVGHILLYAVALVVLPLSGWYWSSLADKPILVAGLFVLSPLVDPDQSLYGLAKWTHTYAAWLCGALVGGHILIALKHHFIDKDDVLRGMLLNRSKC